MLILAGTELIGSELSAITPCINLIKLDLSSNQIINFPPDIDFSQLNKLRLFYLHNNLIADVENLRKLFKIKNLCYLTIFNNPIAT
jgi:Leucine-rich repeat (LRR) protein